MWSHDLKREVRAEFNAAQRMARQIIDRVGDEPEVVLGPRVELVEEANRRIVKGTAT
jgi:hypothetical protein